MGTATASVAPHSRTAAPCLVADRVTPRDQLRVLTNNDGSIYDTAGKTYIYSDVGTLIVQGDHTFDQGDFLFT
jgi:hypothetical protein